MAAAIVFNDDTPAEPAIASETTKSRALKFNPLEARAVISSEAVPVTVGFWLVVTWTPVRPSIVFRSAASSDVPATTTVSWLTTEAGKSETRSATAVVLTLPVTTPPGSLS